MRVTPQDLSGRVYLITGATSGLGLWHATRLVEMNASVVIAARNGSKAWSLAKKIRSAAAAQGAIGTLEVAEAKLDLASLDSVRAFAKYWEESGRPLHVLVNNAAELGPVAGQNGPVITADGFERCFEINYLSHLLLTELLLPTLRKSAPARVVHVSAKAHEWGRVDLDGGLWVKNSTDYDSRSGPPMGNLMGTYADSKLMQIMYSQLLGRRLQGSGVASHSLHPAITETNLAHSMHSDLLSKAFSFFFLKVAGRIIGMTHTEAEAVMTQLHVSIAPALGHPAAPRYFSPEAAPLEACGRAPEDCGVEAISDVASDEALQQKLWEASRRLVGLEGE